MLGNERGATSVWVVHLSLMVMINSSEIELLACSELVEVTVIRVLRVSVDDTPVAAKVVFAT